MLSPHARAHAHTHTNTHAHTHTHTTPRAHPRFPSKFYDSSWSDDGSEGEAGERPSVGRAMAGLHVRGGNRSATARARLLLCDDGTSALGLSVSHTLADGSSFFQFVRQWACETRHRLSLRGRKVGAEIEENDGTCDSEDDRDGTTRVNGAIGCNLQN